MAKWIRIVIAIVVLSAALLPGRQLSAMPASQVPVEIPANIVSDTLWMQHAMIAFEKSEPMGKVAAIKFLRELYDVAPGLPPDVATSEVQQFANYYRYVVTKPQVLNFGEQGSYESVLAFLTDAGHALATNFKSTPTLNFSTSSSAAAMRELVRDWAGEIEQAKRATVDAHYLLETSSVNVPLNIDLMAPLSVDALQGARDLKLNVEFSKAFDRQFSAELNINLQADAGIILQVDGDLRELYKGLLSSSGEIRASLDQLKNLASSQIKKVNEQITKDQSTITEVNKLQQFVDKYIVDPEKRKQAEKYVSDRNKERAEILNVARPAILGLSKLIALASPKVAKQIETVGMAAIQIADGVGKVVTAIGAIAQFGLSAGAIASGAGAVQGIVGIVGAVSSIISLFSDSEATAPPEQQTMEMIQQLSQQIAALGNQMNERFDRIDQSLNQIYGTLVAGFARMEELLQKVAAGVFSDLSQIKQELANIQQDLNELQDQLEIRTNGIYNLLASQGKRELLDAANLYLNYPERYKILPDYSKEFIPAQDKFYNWGTQTGPGYLYTYGSRDKDQKLTPQQLEKQLSGESGTIDENLTYLARYMATHYFSQDPAENGFFAPLDQNPHMGIWAFSSSAYAQLMSEEPDYAGRIEEYQSRMKHLASVGQALKSNFSSITLTSQGKAKSKLFEKMVGAYTSAYTGEDGLEKWLQDEERNFIAAWNDERNATEPASKGNAPDIWGGAKQPHAYLPKLDSAAYQKYLPPNMRSCSSSTSGALTSPNIRAMVPSELLLGQYLGLGTLRYCYTQTRIVPHEKTCTETVCRRECEPERRPPCVTVCEPVEYDCSFTTEHITAFNILFNDKSVGNYRADGQATLNAEEKQHLETSAAGVEARLKAKQQELYSFLAGRLAANPDSAQRLQSAKLLLRTMVTLGLPRAVGSDEYLHDLLFGSDGLLDRTLLVEIYSQAARGQLVVPSNIRTDPSTDVRATILSRADSLKKKLMDYLGMLERKEYIESHPLIESTLNELALTSNLTRQRCDEFKVTGQCSYGTIVAFWEKNGALPVFGWPTTSIQQRVTSETGNIYTYQWFERARIESHPPITGRPGEVLLGLLGVERLQQIGRKPEPPVEERRVAECRYFAPTGHNVCNQQGNLGFRSYWESHGLQDSSRSADANSLMLFGYPITEAKEEKSSTDGKMYTTQWFQRARLEWHPENGEEFRVLLGLLGNEVKGSNP